MGDLGSALMTWRSSLRASPRCCSTAKADRERIGRRASAGFAGCRCASITTRPPLGFRGCQSWPRRTGCRATTQRIWISLSGESCRWAAREGVCSFAVNNWPTSNGAWKICELAVPRSTCGRRIEHSDGRAALSAVRGPTRILTSSSSCGSHPSAWDLPRGAPRPRAPNPSGGLASARTVGIRPRTHSVDPLLAHVQ